MKVFDKGIAQFKRAEASSFGRISRQALALAVPAILSVGVAHADAATIGLGADGAPAAADYLTAAHGFQSAIAPILTALLTFLLAMWGVWKGPAIIKRLLSKYVAA